MDRFREYFHGGVPTSPAERKLLRKIDLTLLPILCLMYWSNYLNRTNFQFAYVSGMRQELGYAGNQFGTTNSIFTIPHAFLVTKIPARYYFPACAVTWGVLGACLSATTSPEQVYAIRFLIALVEACTFSGSHYLLGAWYKPVELGKRAGLFACSAQLGSLFSGVLQGAIYDGLNGVHGRSGWRWTYIIDGIIAIAIGLFAFIIFPSTPAMGASPFFTAEEIQLAQDRLPKREPIRLTFRNVWKVVTTQIYVGFSVLFAFGSQLEAYGTNGIMPLWLSSLNAYPTSRVSYYALGLTAFAIVVTVVAGIFTDVYGRRWLTVFPIAIGMIISASIILAFDVPRAALFFAFYVRIAYVQQGSFFAWASEATSSDLERSVVLFSMNLWSNAVTAWWGPIVFFPATAAPRWRRGMISTLIISPLLVVWAAGLRYLEIRRRKRNNAMVKDDESVSKDVKEGKSDSSDERHVEAGAFKSPESKF